jgi:hypothetical protein
MANHKILIDTATTYKHHAENDSSCVLPSKVLNDAIRELGLTEKSSSTEISNSEQYVVIRTQEMPEKPELIRHPLDFVEKGIEAGIEALKNRGILDTTHICLIAIPRSSLTSTFTHVYEVVRRCDWSVLPLGGSDDGQDISRLCNAYKVDTIFIAADAIDSVFASSLTGQFDCVKSLLYVTGTPSQAVVERVKSEFPHIEIYPYLYQSDITGPIGLPTQRDENDEFEVLENMLVEVESAEDAITLNGSGHLLISVLGLEQPTLIRRDIGDFGVLTTDDEGRQVVRLCGRNPL